MPTAPAPPPIFSYSFHSAIILPLTISFKSSAIIPLTFRYRFPTFTFFPFSAFPSLYPSFIQPKFPLPLHPIFRHHFPIFISFLSSTIIPLPALHYILSNHFPTSISFSYSAKIPLPPCIPFSAITSLQPFPSSIQL
jgi:hypothetical protein